MVWRPLWLRIRFYSSDSVKLYFHILKINSNSHVFILHMNIIMYSYIILVNNLLCFHNPILNFQCYRTNLSFAVMSLDVVNSNSFYSWSFISLFSIFLCLSFFLFILSFFPPFVADLNWLNWRPFQKTHHNKSIQKERKFNTKTASNSH